MTEWQLVGSDLAALIAYQSMDMRVTRRKAKQFLSDVFGLSLSMGTLQNCIVESARALEPVEAQLIEDLCSESIMHADETSHNEAERALRHWVIMRKITQGTNSEQGRRALAWFVSVFVTCRLRNGSPLLYIRDVIKLRRQGRDTPKLPQIPGLVAV